MPDADISVTPAGAWGAGSRHDEGHAAEGQAALALAPEPDGAVRTGVLPIEAVPAAVVALLHAFLNLRGSNRRLAPLVADLGATPLLSMVDGALVFASAPAPDGAIQASPSAAPAPDTLVLAHLPFGRTTAQTLDAVSDLADQFGDGTIRITPWRALVLPGIAPERAPEIRAALVGLGLITAPDDPRLRIDACAGRPRCSHAHADVQADAGRLAAILPREAVPPEAVPPATRTRSLDALPPGTRLHLSGCAKGCARTGPAAVTLTAAPDGYRLVRNGRAGDPAEATGLSVADAVRLLATSFP